jgi:hypothetical protein
LRRVEGGGREAAQNGRTVNDDHVAQVQPAVGDAGRVEERHLLPQLSQRLLLDLLGERVLERLDVRLAGDHQHVAVRP